MVPNVSKDNPLLRYDFVLRIQFSRLDETSERRERAIEKLLEKGLGDRITEIQNLDHIANLRGSDTNELVFGLNIDEEKISRTIDRGPDASDKRQSKSFRDFWGAKAELRRFKDGSIQESLVWNSKTPIELLREIISYLIKTHQKQANLEEIIFVGHEDKFLSIRQQIVSENEFVLRRDFEVLQKTIRSLEGLPLSIDQIQAAVLLTGHPTLLPADVVIQFEASSRWPDDLTAIQMTKTAFLLKLDERLSVAQPKWSTRIGLENENVDILNKSFLDVIYQDGACFRLRIHHDREQTLLQRILVNKLNKAPQREMAALAMTEYKRLYIKRPIHTQSINNLVTRCPALVPTMHLVKYWFNLHLLGPHFGNELIELFVARAFLPAASWKVPASPLTGLLRVIWLLSNWDWQKEPWIVEFNESLTNQERTEIKTRFQAWRKLDPMMNRLVLFAVTNTDQDGATWTEFSPSKVISARMTSLAQASFDLLRIQGLNADVRTIFDTPMDDYDFVIKLHKIFAQQVTDSQPKTPFKNLQKDQQVDTSLIDYAPAVAYAKELERIFGDSIVIFYNPQNCTTITGIWKPYTDRRKWKAGLTYSSFPVQNDYNSEEANALINKEAVLHEMGRLGDDMVSKIVVNR